MDKLIENFTSTQWWIGVVIVGIAINIFSSYFKKWIDKLFSLISDKWKDMSEIRKQKYERKVQELLQSPNELSFLGFDELRHRIRYVGFTVIAIILFLCAESAPSKILFVICMFSALVTVLVALIDHTEAMKIKKLISDVREQIRTNHNNI